MQDVNARFTDSVRELQRIQQLLQLLLDDTSEILAEQPDDETDQWLVAVVDKMLANLRDQFRIEEEGGYMPDVLEQYPAWHPQVEHLQQEHALLERQLEEIASRLWRERLAGSVTGECRRQVSDWLQWYRDHQRREMALVQEAFVLGVGQEE